MARHPNRWDKSNWTPGKVTLFNALGLGRWNIQYPAFSAQLPGAISQAQGTQAASKVNAPTSSSGGVTPSNATEKAFWTAVLKSLGAPANDANIKSLTAWRQKESPWNAQGPDGAQYTNNPLNTTLSTSNVVGSVNSVGVKRYNTTTAGVAATVQTLLGGYPQIVARLKSGQGLCGWSSGEFSTWSGGGYSSVC